MLGHHQVIGPCDMNHMSLETHLKSLGSVSLFLTSVLVKLQDKGQRRVTSMDYTTGVPAPPPPLTTPKSSHLAPLLAIPQRPVVRT